MSYTVNPYRNAITGEWNVNPSYKEILRLEQMLTEAGIPHTFDRSFDGWQVCYPVNEILSNKRVVSVIEHYGSYGKDDDKLEIMGLLTPNESEYDSVLGYLTAEDVFERIRKHWDGEWYDCINSLSINNASEPEEDSNDAPVTPEEFAAEMRRLYEEEGDDEESVHSYMDIAMCDLLRRLGYGDGVTIFESTPKWYA